MIFPSLFRFASLSLILVSLSVVVRAEDAATNKPPDTGALYKIEGTLDLSDFARGKGASVSAGQAKDSTNPAIEIKFFPTTSGAFPSLYIPVPIGGWDLSGYAGVEAQLYNPGEKVVAIYLRVDNAGEWTDSPWSVQVLRLKPGESGTLRTEFGKCFGKTASTATFRGLITDRATCRRNAFPVHPNRNAGT